MRKNNCQSCGQEQLLSQMYRVDGKTLCEPCADQVVASAKVVSQKIDVAHEIDPTVCARCNTDYGSTELPLVGGAPFCAQCSEGLYDRPFPQWLKLGLAGSLMLLAVALWHGRSYFTAGRQLVLAERAMDRHDYAQAEARFAEVLKINPSEQNVLLQAAKADLLNGDVMAAQRALKRRETYESSELFTEVDRTFTRAAKAWEKADEAGKLLEDKKPEEASKMMSEAAALYPESRALSDGADYYTERIVIDRAWKKKDYDTFVAIAMTAMQKHPGDPSRIASAASAQACKYAVTGDPQFRKRAEELLAQAQALSEKSAEDRASFQEYAERIRYRLESREIIERDEYDRRFRAKKGNS
jgi:hypothetical protein